MEQSDADRAAVAREVLTPVLAELAEWPDAYAFVEKYMQRNYPAPPAPETVTVDGVTYTQDKLGDWYDEAGVRRYSSEYTGPFLRRIASDARVIRDLQEANAKYLVELNAFLVCIAKREKSLALALREIVTRDARIAELEKELHETRERQLPMVRLRDEAYRQRDAARARIAELENELRRALDGTVFHEKQAYEARTERDAALRALEASKHPVATRETVERVALAVRDADLSRSYLVPMHVYHKLARAALTAAGFTLEEGA